jgi:hypothetical protein
MKSVRVYYAGIPARNTKKEKRDVLTNFHLGVPDGQSKEIEQAVWQPSDLAVIQGWVHPGSVTSPHLMFRKHVIDKQKSIGKHTIAIDSNLFLYLNPGNTQTYLRFSLDGVFPTTGNYFRDKIDPKRLLQIQTDIGFQMKDWRSKGDHILLCLQRNGGWSMNGLNVMEWCNKTIKKIKDFTDRPIVVRAHPGDSKAREYLKLNWPGVTVSRFPTIQHDLNNAWATVTYNSSPGVASAIEGVPVFVTDPEPRKSQAFEIANFKLKEIENPRMPERQEWLEAIAMSHFSFRDLRSGTAWNIIKDYI